MTRHAKSKNTSADVMRVFMQQTKSRYEQPHPKPPLPPVPSDASAASMYKTLQFLCSGGGGSRLPMRLLARALRKRLSEITEVENITRQQLTDIRDSAIDEVAGEVESELVGNARDIVRHRLFTEVNKRGIWQGFDFGNPRPTIPFGK